MWLVDTALKGREEENRPIQVAIVGAGFMGQGLTNQIIHSTPGMNVAAVYNRRVERAVGAFHYAGLEHVVVAKSQKQLDDAISRSQPVATEDEMLLARSELIDVRGCHRIRGVWRTPRSGSFQAWQRRCSDERRA